MQYRYKNEIKILLQYVPGLLICSLFIFYTILCQKKALILDEFIMLITAKRPFIESLLQTQDYSAPFYQILLRLFIWNNHPSALILRIPAAFAAALCLFVSWKLVQKKTNDFLAIAFIILLGLNPFFINWATMARPYTFYGLFFVCCLFLACEIINSYSDKNVVLFIVSSVLLAYTTFIGLPITVLMVFLTTILLPTRQEKIRFLKWNTVTFFCLIPVVFLLMPYILEGVPALHGSWILKPTLIIFLTGVRFSQFFGDPYSGGMFFTFFLIAITVFSHNLVLYLKNNSTNGHCYYLLKKFKDQRVLWIFILIFILSLFYLANACSFYFPIYLGRYAFPVVILMLVSFFLIIENFPRATQIVFFLIICVLYWPHLESTYMDKRDSILYAGSKINKLVADHRPVYLINWKHATDWTSPEYFGLRYYGYNVQNCKFINLNYGDSHSSIKNTDFLQESPHAAILVYGAMRNIFVDFFNKHNIKFQRQTISDYTIFYY